MATANQNLANKLDGLDKQDLDIMFDEAVLWGQVEDRLSVKKKRQRAYWLAACIAAMILLIPLALLQFTGSEVAPVAPVAQITPPAEAYLAAEEVSQPTLRVEKTKVTQTRILKVDRMEVAMLEVGIPKPVLDLSPVAVTHFKTEKKQRALFAQEDISVIQASLEQPSAEKGRKMSIRAQWQSSENEVLVSNQEFKIKLYEKQE